MRDPVIAYQLGQYLSEYEKQVIQDKVQVRTVVMNRLMQISQDEDNKVALKALELLGKASDLFVEHSEITITHKNSNELKEAITEQTALIYIETPSNPLLNIIDIKSVTHIAKHCNIKTMIDNTFASPINQNPAQLGCDLIMHSATKYLGGHSDFCAGALAGSSDIIEQCRLLGTMYGCSLNASDLALLERSMKTLAIRVEKQNHNAMEIAHYLQDHPAISTVYFPGLITHPGHIIAKEQMHGFGGMMSFELKNEDKSAISRFLDSLNIIIPAGSLGGVESLITSPALTSHKLIGEHGRQSYGIKDNLLRLSVGIENIEDLINDLSFALKEI